MRHLIFLPLLFFAAHIAIAQDSHDPANVAAEETRSIEVLIDLLGDERLGDEAVAALEKMSSKETAAALRSQLDTAKAHKLINVVRVLGALRDEDSVTKIGILTLDKDGPTALAAIDSLGKIGSDDAIARLRNTLKSRNPAMKNAAADAIIAFCNRLIETESGENHEKEIPKVVELAKELRSMDDLSIGRRTAATRALVLGSGEKGIELILGLLYEEDDAMFDAAIEIAREFRNEDFIRVYTSELPEIAPKRQPKALLVLKDRDDLRFLPSTVLKLAKSGMKATKLATIEVIAVHGHSGCVPVLLETLGSNDPDLAKAARDTLAILKGEDFDESIALELRSENKQIRMAAISLAGQRKITTAKNDLAMIATNITEPDDIRAEAILALGNVVDLEMLTGMVGAMDRSTLAAEKTKWQTAIKTAAARMADRDAATRKLLVGLENAKTETKIAVVEILPAIGGQTALETLVAAIGEKDAGIRDAAFESLKKWKPLHDAIGPMIRMLEYYSDKDDAEMEEKITNWLNSCIL